MAVFRTGRQDTLSVTQTHAELLLKFMCSWKVILVVLQSWSPQQQIPLLASPSSSQQGRVQPSETIRRHQGHGLDLPTPYLVHLCRFDSAWSWNLCHRNL